MKRLIDISDEEYEGYKRIAENYIVGSSVQKILDSTPLPEGAEILTKEAYSDLCLRASKERKTGKWFVLHDEYGDVVEAVCSLCDINGNHTWQYCPHCGAKMEGAEE